MDKYDEVIRDLMNICFENGWTQTRLAQEMGITPVMCNRILNRKITPTTWNLNKLEWFIEKHKEL